MRGNKHPDMKCSLEHMSGKSHLFARAEWLVALVPVG